MKRASLNHTYRLVWSDIAKAFVAVSETTKAKGKNSRAGRSLAAAVSAMFMSGDSVLLYHADTHKLEQRSIKTGISNWDYTEVLTGLKAGDRIVASLERAGVKASIVVKPENVADAARAQ